MRNLLPAALLFALHSICSAQSPTGAGGFETAPVFRSADVLPPALVVGPHHRVRESAPSDGYLIHYTIDSDFGVYKCIGTRELTRRVSEIQAIAVLVAVSKGDLFARGLKQSVVAPIDAVKNIVQDPVESAKQAPKTVGHFFSKLGSSVGNAAKDINKRFQQAGNDGDTAGAVVDTGKALGVGIRNAAGFEKAELDCARQLGVDPYSDNARLQSEMEKVAWAFFAGGLPLRVGVAAASGGASTALTATKAVGLPEYIYDTTPAELALRDRKMLVSLGIAAASIDAVFLNHALSDSVRHGVIQSLQKLPSGPGQTAVIAVLSDANAGGRAAFLAEVLQILSQRHQVTPYKSLSFRDRLPVGVRADGTVEVVAPVDFISWTADVAGFARRDDLSASGRTLVLYGKLSERADSQLDSAGWKIEKH